VDYFCLHKWVDYLFLLLSSESWEKPPKAQGFCRCAKGPTNEFVVEKKWRSKSRRTERNGLDPTQNVRLHIVLLLLHNDLLICCSHFIVLSRPLSPRCRTCSGSPEQNQYNFNAYSLHYEGFDRGVSDVNFGITRRRHG
jgi:hypothetical protein